MELDSELIIMEVQKFPCIYDIYHCEYKNRDLKRESWIGISSAVVGEERWATLDANNKANIGKDIQKRWKSMKDSYFKTLKTLEGRSGDPSMPKKPYIYHKQMSFLQSVAKQRATGGNMNNNGAVEPGPNSRSLPYSAPEPSSVSALAPTPRNSNKRKSDQFEKDILEILTTNVQQTPKCADPDEMFLLSQIPIIKKLNPSDKLDFQIRFMQLLQSYTTAHSNPPTPYPFSTSFQGIVSPSSPVISREISPPDHNTIISDDDSVISFLNL